MSKVKSVLTLILLTVLIGVIIGIAIPFHAMLVNSSNIISQVNSALKGKHANGDDGLIVQTQLLVSNAREAMNALKQTSQSADRISKSQVSRSTELTDASIDLIKAGKETVTHLSSSVNDLDSVIKVAKDSIVRTDNSLNAEILPAVKSTLDATTKSLDEISGPDGLLTQSAIAVKSAGVVIGDPHIVEIISHVDAMSASAATGVETVSQIAGFVRDDLNPSKAKITLKAMLLQQGLKALPDFLIQLFLRKFSPEQVDVKSLPQTQSNLLK